MSQVLENTTSPMPIGPIGDNGLFDQFIASHSGENAWIEKRRKAAWNQFHELPMPRKKDESWRFASRLAFEFNDFKLVEQPDATTIGKVVERSNLNSSALARLVFADNYLVHEDPLSMDLQTKGVVFESFDQAVQKHGGLLEQYLFREEAHLGSEKFVALNTALSNCGGVVYVPKGVVVDQPLLVYHWATKENVAVFPHTLIIAEEGASVNVIDVYQSLDSDAPAFCAASGNIYAEANAQVMRKCVQNWNQSTISFQNDATAVKKDGVTKTLAVNLGSKRARFENQVRMAEPGSHATLYSLTVAQGDQEFDQRTYQSHDAPNAVSDLLYKNALLDNSRTIFSGMINVAKDAQHTDAYQTNRNLLLSPEADANSLPGLEIQANDVKCSHGATTGQLDPDELFYMMQRGIHKRTAQQLMVFGFFEEVIEKFDNEEIKNNVRELVQSKFHL
ncbi:MAG: Fe-S cluster assembly protein SufD [Opitutales bacterium]|nr:Fe-S cluster assembly protein SufD [Opitutales bacterium]